MVASLTGGNYFWGEYFCTNGTTLTKPIFFK